MDLDAFATAGEAPRHESRWGLAHERARVEAVSGIVLAVAIRHENDADGLGHVIAVELLPDWSHSRRVEYRSRGGAPFLGWYDAAVRSQAVT
mgnify:CR=1 FL=1